jgi:hypothetical protein
MTPRLVLLTEIISPYRIPLFNTLAKRGKVDLHVIFLAETDPGLRQWQVYKQEIKFSYEVLPSWRKRIGKFHALINGGEVLVSGCHSLRRIQLPRILGGIALGAHSQRSASPLVGKQFARLAWWSCTGGIHKG